MGLIAAVTFVAGLNAATASGAALHRFAPHVASVAVAVAPASASRDRAPRAYVAPVVAYAAASTEPVAGERRGDMGAFGDVATYAAFEPERAVLPVSTRRETLLARVRRAASRVLAVAKRMPHF